MLVPGGVQKVSAVGSEMAMLQMGSLKTASSVLLVVRGGREVRGGGMPSESDMEYEVPMSVRGDMTVETLGISRSFSSLPSDTAEGVRAGRMGRGMAVPVGKGRRGVRGGRDGTEKVYKWLYTCLYAQKIDLNTL